MNRRTINRLEAYRSNSDGSIAILFALTIVAVVGVTGMAIDYGRAIAAKLRLQIATDAATMAGASLPATANQNRFDVALKTFNANILGTELQGTVPSINATNAGVSITASTTIKTTFANVLGVEEINISTAASARSQIQNGGVVCLLALNPTTQDGLHLQGINKVQSEDCWAWVNSNHDTSINAVGASSGTGQGFCTHGGVVGADHFSPTPYTKCEPMPDPFAEKMNNYDVDMTCDFSNKQYSSGTFVMQPGTYCGNTLIKPQALVTMQPGLYVFKDGYLQIQAQGSLTGDGVTLFFVGQSTKIDIRGGGNVDLRAPTTGDLAGFVIVDRVISWYDTTVRETTIQGGGHLKLEGILYAPQWRMNISGSGDINQKAKFFAMIADHFYMEGNGKLYVDSDAVGAGMPDLMPKIKNGPLLLN